MHDVVIRGGTVYDGEGGPPYAADVAIDGDLIAAVMPAIGDRGHREIDVTGLAVAPGSDARGVRRGIVDGSADRRDAPRPDRTPGGYQVRHSVDHPPTGARSPGAAWRFSQRRVVRRGDHP